MANLRKVVMTPYVSDEETELFDEQSGGNIIEPPNQTIPQTEPKNRIKRYAMDRQRKLLKIILRLASVNGYDSQERIKLRNGTYLDQSDVVSLLLYTLSPGKKVVGLEEFVELLKEAGVTSEMVINENVKAMLENRRTVTVPKQIQYQPPPVDDQEMRETTWKVKGHKRKRQEEERGEDSDDTIIIDPKVSPMKIKRVMKKAKRSKTEIVNPPATYAPRDNTFRDNNTGWIQSSEEEDNSE